MRWRQKGQKGGLRRSDVLSKRVTSVLGGKREALRLVGCLPVFSEVGQIAVHLLLSRVFSWGAILRLPIDTFFCDSYIGDSSAERRILMANVTITFSDTEQQEIEGIVIDKDQDEALQVVSKLLDKIKEHPGHACGPKVV
jgi:hypothetical protein